MPDQVLRYISGREEAGKGLLSSFLINVFIALLLNLNRIILNKLW